MGVGELSALNGVAGAYTEQVKMIHIVGTTPTNVQAKRLMIHHSLGPNPDHKVGKKNQEFLALADCYLYKVYEKISSHVRCAYAWLEDRATATIEVDVRYSAMKRYLPLTVETESDQRVHAQFPSGLYLRPNGFRPRSRRVLSPQNTHRSQLPHQQDT